MGSPRVKVLYHDNCFDGATSAALFSRAYAERIDSTARFDYLGKSHGQGAIFGEGDADLDGDVNVVVDFRFSASPRLTWWFDHHVSAFPTSADEASFRSQQSPRHFFDPKARSCSKFLADTFVSRFGWDARPHAELIHWADLIDGAQFESPEAAVALAEPALRLMTWVENNHDPALKLRFISELVSRPLADIANETWVTSVLAPVLARHGRAVDVIRARARMEHSVVFFDVTEDGLDGHNKFIPYALYPDCTYVVGVSQSASRTKVSVGSNPWRPGARTVNIAAVCERYGGGGHPVVGAVSLKGGEVARARQIAAEIVEELARATQASSQSSSQAEGR